MSGQSAEYLREWRKNNPHKWHLTQLRWYYKNRKRIIQGQSRPKGPEPDEYDEWLRRFE